MNGLKEMAIEAGMHYRALEDEFCKANADGVPMEMLEAFAKLVHQRGWMDGYTSCDNDNKTLTSTLIAHAVEEEREACAKVCETGLPIATSLSALDDMEMWGEKFAAAIRARSCS